MAESSERQLDVRTGKQTQTERWTDRQTDKQKDGQADTDRDTDKCNICILYVGQLYNVQSQI